MLQKTIWSSPEHHLSNAQPDQAILYFCSTTLRANLARFQAGFPGLVTYAVKANPHPEVLENLVAQGMTAFDVASPAEIDAVRCVKPDAVLHYHNPVRSLDEIRHAREAGVRSYSVDSLSELAKLSSLPQGTEISVRLALPVAGAAYNFGSKFGATSDAAVALLKAARDMGFVTSMTFHPGTQCDKPEAWAEYIRACAEIAQRAGVRLARLNVGGGFASHRTQGAPNLEAIFQRIGDETARAFGAETPENLPELVCEPGRALVAEAFTLAARVKAIRHDGSVFLNDGIYGTMNEFKDVGCIDRVSACAPDGSVRSGAGTPRVIFGPTCDSVDKLPQPVMLPSDLAEEDYVLIRGMGAYSLAVAVPFNGYGVIGPVHVERV